MKPLEARGPRLKLKKNYYYYYISNKVYFAKKRSIKRSFLVTENKNTCRL